MITKDLKSTKGITLISLVVTIVVLLILAGVTIATLTGDNGILSQAQNAQKVSENAAAKEKVRVEVMGSYGIDGRLNLANLIANLGNVGTVTKATFPVEVTVDGKSFTISDTGVVEQLGPRINTSNLKVTTVADKETEITTSSTNKPEGGMPIEISFDVSISVGTITGVNKGTLTEGKVTYDTDGTETEVTFTFTLSGLENNATQAVTINNLKNYYKVKLYGAPVQLNGGNAITVKTVGTTNYTIEDNWKLFYIDDASDGYVHLIYGDYYPADVQTEITSGNTIFSPAHKDNNNNASSDSSYAWSVNSRTDGLTLLKYLKNNSSYSEANLDTSTPAGSYESWTSLATALTTGKGKALNGKTIRVQGAPNITMWVDSWNEQGYTELALDDTGNKATGYNIRLSTAEANSNASYRISLSSYSGYQDRLYFPNRGGSSTTEEPNANKAYGYWLASPCGCSANSVGLTGYDGGVYFCYSSTSNNLSARPVVSILKSDFQNITAFSGISITKY